MANYPIYKTSLIKGVEGEAATDTTAPVGGVIMYDGDTVPAGYEEISDVTGIRLIRKTTPSITNTRPKVTDNIDYDENTEGTAFSIDCIKQVFNELYPVGAIYISVNSINPASIFGGTWQQIKDKYLVCSGDNYTLGDTGGNNSETVLTDANILGTAITEAQTPIHSHQYTRTQSTQETEVTIYTYPNHTHNITYRTPENITTGGSTRVQWRKWSTFTLETSAAGTENVEGHFHNVINQHKYTSEENRSTQAHTHEFTAGYFSFKTMPKYIAVNVWVRTA